MQYLSTFLSDFKLRQRVFLYLGALINLIYGVIKVAAGMIYSSLWLSFMGGYYLILAGFRTYIIRYERKYDENVDMNNEYKRYTVCGYILVGLDIFLIYILDMAVEFKAVVIYPGSLIYGMALYAFVSMGFVIKNLVQIHTISRPLYGAARVASFTAALISMLSLEIAMLGRFGEEDIKLRKVMTILSGAAIFLMVGVMALRMIYVGIKYSNEENLAVLIERYKEKLINDREKRRLRQEKKQLKREAKIVKLGEKFTKKEIKRYEKEYKTEYKRQLKAEKTKDN